MNWNDLLVPVITAAIGYISYLARTWVLAHTTPKQYATVAGLARTAVEGAQQVGIANNLGGADKYALATDALVAGAKRVGLRLKPEEVNAFVHQAVKEMQTYDAQMRPQV